MKGIIFSEHNFHLTVNGVKTQTRRVIKPQPDGRGLRTTNVPFEDWHGREVKPRYKVGETVYLKEPYYKGEGFNGEFTLYKFDGDSLILPHCDKWANSLFMPESAARYFIKITNVRAERLRDISDEDCLKEGIQPFTKDGSVYKYGLDGDVWATMPRTPREAYSVIFDKINGKGSWEKNSWVWVYDYQILK